MFKSINIILMALVTVLSSQTLLARSFPEFTTLVEKASPAVVNITATRNVSENVLGRNHRDDREVPEFFRRFFGDQQRQNPRARPSAGSGFIISADGYILTNNHVIQDATEILVALSDRRERVAELIGADPMSDLALLKIDATDLPSVEFGTSENLKVGEWVVAIGSPFGFELSVTAGIVSAKGRSLPDESGNYVPYIQTDVAINPGNSGGPLFNLDGKVVGINSQIYTRSGGFMGLSFAIPIDVAMEVVAQLKEKGEVSRGWLGVLIQRVDHDLAESFGLERAAGALITQILEGGPASKSGLKEGDIILVFNGHKIDLSTDLPHVVGRTKADTTVKVEVIRAGKAKTIDMKVGLLPDRQARRIGNQAPKLNSRLGIVVDNLSSDQARSAGVKGGVVVTEVNAGPGELAGLRAGDIITTLDGDSINSPAQFQTKSEALPIGEAISLRAVRGQTPEFLVIKIEE